MCIELRRNAASGPRMPFVLIIFLSNPDENKHPQLLLGHIMCHVVDNKR